MTTTGLNRWLKPFSAPSRGSRRGRRSGLAFRPGSESLEQRLALSEVIWTGRGNDRNWATRLNWLNGLAPKDGDDVVFPANASKMISVNNMKDRTLSSITIGGPGYEIGGNPIKVEAGKIHVTKPGGTFALPIEVNQSLTVTVHTLDFAMTGAITGKGNFRKDGEGDLIFQGSSPNTISGEFRVVDGTLLLAKDPGVNAVGRQLLIGVFNGPAATVRLLSNEQIPNQTNSVVQVNEGSTLDVDDETETINNISLVGGKVTGEDTGKLILRGNLQASTGVFQKTAPSFDVPLSLSSGKHAIAVGAGDTLTIDVPISGATSTELIKSGSGVLNLAGTTSNTYAGTTWVSQGTLLLSKSGTKPEDRIAVPGSLVIAGDAVKSASVVRLGASNQLKQNVPVTVNMNGVFDLNTFAARVGSLEMTGGTVKNGSLTLAGDVSATSGKGQTSAEDQPATISAALHLAEPRRTRLSRSLDTNFIVNRGPAAFDLILSGTINGDAGVGLAKKGAGTLLLSPVGSNTYSGVTTVQAGTLYLRAGGSMTNSIPGPLTIGDAAKDAPAAVVQLQSDNEIKDNAPVIVNHTGVFDLNNRIESIGGLTLVGGQVKTGTGALSLNGDVTATSVSKDQPSRISGKLRLGPDGLYTREFTVLQGPAADDLIITGAVIGAKGVEFEKDGFGTLEFGGAASNTYEGHTTVFNGVLKLNKTDGAKAIVGGLTIGGVHPGEVVLLGNQQLDGNTPVSVVPNGELLLNDKNQSIGGLVMRGGLVSTGKFGLLTVGGVVESKGSPSAPPKITGRINLNHATTTFLVDSGSPLVPSELIVDAEFLNGGTIKKTGEGTMVLSGDGLQPATASVEKGNMVLFGTRPLTAVQLNGGILTGDGTIKSISTSTATGGATPGGSIKLLIKRKLFIGTLTRNGVLGASGDVTLDGSTALVIKLKGGSQPKRGSNFDQLTAAGQVNLNGAQLSLQLPDFQKPAKGTRFRIINNSSDKPLVGTFGGLPDSGSLVTAQTADGKVMVFSIDYRVGTNHNDADLVFKGELD